MTNTICDKCGQNFVPTKGQEHTATLSLTQDNGRRTLFTFDLDPACLALVTAALNTLLPHSAMAATSGNGTGSA